MIHQNISQKQQTRILPQQIQLLNIFHLTTMELDQRILQELEENPLLEEVAQDEKTEENRESQQDFADWEEYGYDDIPNYKTEYANYFSEQQMPERPIPQGSDFRANIKEQVRMLVEDDNDFAMACFLIDSLNDSGMLDQDLSTLAEDFSFTVKKWIEPEELEKLLMVIQTIDPPGLGARNIRECLLLQLEKKDRTDPQINMAYRLIADHFEDLNNRQLEKIMMQLKLEEEQLRQSLELIASLSLKPVDIETDEAIARNYIIPDFIITVEEDELEISLARQRSASLSINRGWMENIKTQCHEKDKAASYYLKSKLQAAEWFVSAIVQRENTMLKIMRSIVKWQYDYFRVGDPLLLKPMILKNIAEETGADISTVSRVTSNKYASTPFGNILLKDLFTEGLPSDTGETVSSRVIQHELKEVIDQEDKKRPFTDHQLVTMLEKKGYKIARRTVAKYREMLRIPTAQLRAIWK
ncbi:MAG TPA: RNA polymerase factor sigma-54 [Chitinophagaceae bacterium]|nr:RNA polymerase factor sigma-54 [Chitinophagaceae bacterium]